MNEDQDQLTYYNIVTMWTENSVDPDQLASLSGNPKFIQHKQPLNVCEFPTNSLEPDQARQKRLIS